MATRVKASRVESTVASERREVLQTLPVIVEKLNAIDKRLDLHFIDDKIAWNKIDDLRIWRAWLTGALALVTFLVGLLGAQVVSWMIKS